MAEAHVTAPSPEDAASLIVAAIRHRDWPALVALLAANPESIGQVAPWQRPGGPPTIADRSEVQRIPESMLRYPGRMLVRYDTPGEPRVYKLEVVVEPCAGGFRAIDFWGLGW
jgi:hypothetical protein